MFSRFGNEDMQTLSSDISEFEELFIKVDTDIDCVYDFIGKNPSKLLQKHRDGRTLLHKAIEAVHTDLIEKLIETNRNVLFINNDQGLSPLAYTLKKYYHCKNLTFKGIANQIYFKLGKGQERNSMVNQRVNMHQRFAFLHERLWEFGLNLCFIKDDSGNIVNVDKDWIDFVVQVVNDGLHVDYGLGGADVNNRVMLYFVKQQYPSRAYVMFDDAVTNQETGLRQRTLTLMLSNTSLANSVEMRGRIPQHFYLRLELSLPNPIKDQSIYFFKFGDDYYYQDKTSITKIDPSRLNAIQLESYNRLTCEKYGRVAREVNADAGRDILLLKPMSAKSQELISNLSLFSGANSAANLKEPDNVEKIQEGL